MFKGVKVGFMWVPSGFQESLKKSKDNLRDVSKVFKVGFIDIPRVFQGDF